MEESKDCCVDVDVLFQRRRKRRKILGEGEFFFWRRRKTEKEKEENIWRKSLQKLSRILRSLGFDFGLGLEIFANFWRVLVWFGFGHVSYRLLSSNVYTLAYKAFETCS